MSQRQAPGGANALAKERGIDLSKITGTGPEGLITKADVLRVERAPEIPAKVPAPSSSASSSSTDNRALSAMAATVIASKRDIPHFYATTDVSMSQAAAWRRRWNEDHADLHATYNDLFVLCAARSLLKT